MDSIHISINKKFLAGMIFAVAVSSLQKDYWGMEGTIRHVVNDWVSPWITVPISTVGLLAAFWLCVDPTPRKGA